MGKTNLSYLQAMVVRARNLESYSRRTYRAQIGREYEMARIALDCYRANQQSGAFDLCVEAAVQAMHHRRNAAVLRTIATGGAL